MFKVVNEQNVKYPGLTACYQFRSMMNPLYNEESNQKFFDSRIECYKELTNLLEINNIDCGELNKIELEERLRSLWLPDAMAAIDDLPFVLMIIDDFTTYMEHERVSKVPKITEEVEKIDK